VSAPAIAACCCCGVEVDPLKPDTLVVLVHVAQLPVTGLLGRGLPKPEPRGLCRPCVKVANSEWAVFAAEYRGEKPTLTETPS
jgi:hypothetical protein